MLSLKPLIKLDSLRFHLQYYEVLKFLLNTGDLIEFFELSSHK